MSEELKKKLQADDGKPQVGQEAPDADFIAAAKGVAMEQDPANVELPAVETPKQDAPKVETPKVEQPKVEVPKVETPKVEAPKVEQPTNIVDINKVVQEMANANKELAAALKPKPVEETPVKMPTPEELFAVSPDEADSLLAGGEPAAKVLQSIQVRNMQTMAKLVMSELEALKSQVLGPIIAQQRSRVAQETKDRFFAAYPDLKDWEQECFNIGQAAMQLVGKGTLRFQSEGEFHDYIASEARKMRDTYRARLGAPPVAAPVVAPKGGSPLPPPPPAPSSRPPAGGNNGELGGEQEEMRRVLMGLD